MKVCYFDAFCGIGGDMTGAGGYGRSGGAAARSSRKRAVQGPLSTASESWFLSQRRSLKC